MVGNGCFMMADADVAAVDTADNGSESSCAMQYQFYGFCGLFFLMHWLASLPYF